MAAADTTDAGALAEALKTAPAGNEVRADTTDGSVLTEAAGLTGQRLDHALGALLPALGLRGRRRMLESGRVLVNGRPAAAARRLRPKDVLTVLGAPPEAAGAQAEEGAPGGPDAARLVERQGDYCFFYKPAGMHTVALAGGGGHSLEALLPRLTAGMSPPLPAGQRCQLLQRLDCETSGLICAALSPEAARAFRAAEAEGRCEKRYVALLEGRLAGPLTARSALTANGRDKSALLNAPAHKTRWTDFWPLHVWSGQEGAALAASLLAARCQGQGVSGALPDCAQGLTLAACRIRRGARHQIRVHAAALGYGLWGDARYALTPQHTDRRTARGVFFLHHGALRLPGAFCALAPPWLLPAPLAALALAWFEGARG